MIMSREWKWTGTYIICQGCHEDFRISSHGFIRERRGYCSINCCRISEMTDVIEIPNNTKWQWIHEDGRDNNMNVKKINNISHPACQVCTKKLSDDIGMVCSTKCYTRYMSHIGVSDEDNEWLIDNICEQCGNQFKTREIRSTLCHHCGELNESIRLFYDVTGHPMVYQFKHMKHMRHRWIDVDEVDMHPEQYDYICTCYLCSVPDDLN